MRSNSWKQFPQIEIYSEKLMAADCNWGKGPRLYFKQLSVVIIVKNVYRDIWLWKQSFFTNSFVGRDFPWENCKQKEPGNPAEFLCNLASFWISTWLLQANKKCWKKTSKFIEVCLLIFVWNPKTTVPELTVEQEKQR